jgi:hypothetical protein
LASGPGVTETVRKLGQGLDNRRIMDRFLTESKAFFLYQALRTTMGPTQSPVHWLTRIFSSEVKHTSCEIDGVTRWRSWLRHCATSRKVVASILGGVIGIFYWFNPTGRTVALGSTHSQTEMSKDGWCVGLTNLPHSCADFFEILGASNSCSPKGLSRPLMG